MVFVQAATLVRQTAAASQPPTETRPPAQPASTPAQAAGAEAQPGAATDPTAPPALPPPPKREVEFSIDLGGLYALPTDIDGGGDVGITRAAGWLGIDVPIADYHLLTIEMSSEFSFYSFDDAVGLDPIDGDPFGNMDEFKFGARLFIRQAVRWGWFVAGEVTSAGESGAEFSDTLRYAAYGGVRYWFSEHLSMSGGVSMRTRFEESTFFAPFVTIDWTINPTWAVRTSTRVLERGMNVQLLYTATPSLTLSLGAGFEPREYRLDDEGLAPEGAVTDTRFPLMLGAGWQATPSVSIHGGLGVYLWQEYDIRDSAGNEVSQRETDPQPSPTLGD